MKARTLRRFLVLLAATSCTSYVSQRLPAPTPVPTLIASRALITLRNHQLLDLREVTAVGDSVIGMSVRDPTRRMAAAMVDIAAIEERRVDVAGPLLIALGVYLMVGLIALVGYDRSGG